MNRQISFQQYRAIDLSILTGLMILTQTLIHVAVNTIYTRELYVVSTVGPIVALVLMRWSAWAAIPAILGGIVQAVLFKASWESYLIYGVGNLLSLAALLWFVFPGKEKLRSDGLLTMFYGFSVQLFMLVGRGLVALVLGHSIGECIGFITADALSLLFTVVAAWVVRRIEGLFEDQKHYLLRIQQERQVEGREQF